MELFLFSPCRNHPGKRFLPWLLLLALVLGSCGEGNDSSTHPLDSTEADLTGLDSEAPADTTPDLDPECPAATLGCPCLEGTCEEDLSCLEGTCREACSVGDQGCACYGNDTCNGDLVCNDQSLCEPSTCPMGAVGCSCYPNDTCNDDLVCNQGVCLVEDCTPGQGGCTCYPNATCDQGWLCGDLGVCVEDLCLPGEEGCLCYPNGTCNNNLKCTSDMICLEVTIEDQCQEGTLGCPCMVNSTCLVEGLVCDPQDSTCQSELCPRGNPGCGCSVEGTCTVLYSCHAGICAFDPMHSQEVPENPKCYTPCRKGWVNGQGNWVPCPSDGLMAGCLDGYECVNGTCRCASVDCTPVNTPASNMPDLATWVIPYSNDDPPSCSTDLECPDWQTCISGNCYSVCDHDGECSEDLRCYRHVCRIPCLEGDDSCPEEMFCETEDGTSGYCKLLPQSQLGDQAETSWGTFSVEENVFLLSPFNNEATFTITNNGNTDALFTIEKANHIKFTDLGTVTIETNALSWLDLDVGTAVDEDPLTILVPAGFSSPVTLSNADGSELDRWDGTIKIEGKPLGTAGDPDSVLDNSLGIRRVYLHFRGSPKGRWTGTMFYFASFPDGELDPWLQDKSNSAKINNLDNALLKRWATFRKQEGDLSWLEFKAVLTATTSESWKFSSVQDRCPPDQEEPNSNMACYLYTDPNGYSNKGLAIYSDNLEEARIPSASTQLPFGMNITAPTPGNRQAWSGRIESSAALHYAGNPTVNLHFEQDPASCQYTNGEFGDCMTFLDSFVADIWVGARMNTVDDDSCRQGLNSYHQGETWLLDDFEAPGGAYECRDPSLPYGGSPQYRNINELFAGSNPLPNGRALHRRLTLLDGAMVNQQEIFILFRESFTLELGTDTDQFQDCDSYGFMRLTLTDPNLAEDDYQGNNQSASTSGDPVDYRVKPPQWLLDQIADAMDPGAVADYVRAFNTSAPSSGDCGTNSTCRDAVKAIATAALKGEVNAEDPEMLVEAPGSDWEVHYLCEDTGVIDRGPTGEYPCPVGSDVIYFATRNHEDFQEADCNQAADLSFNIRTRLRCTDLTTGKSWDFDEMDGDEEPDPDKYAASKCEGKTVSTIQSITPLNLSDETRGTCSSWVHARKDAWSCSISDDPADCGSPAGTECQAGDCGTSHYCDEETGTCRYNFRFDLYPDCDGDAAYCNNPWDLRDDKTFYWASTPERPMSSLQVEIDRAFRYKRKFMSRSGGSLGFAPAVCGDSADDNTYCYDPGAMRKISGRVDSLVHLFTYFGDDLFAVSSQDDNLFRDVKGFLVQNFSYYFGEDDGFLYDGYEPLLSELQVMMADEYYVQAFAARFDVAGTQVASFPGDIMEPPDGINLSGGAGFEMTRLYQSVQYHDTAIRRFYQLLPTLWDSLELLELDDQYITQETVAYYFDKLIKASSRKAQAWNQISSRYNEMGQDDLAKRVIERAYTGIYLESVVFNQVMKRIINLYRSTSDYAQMVKISENAQLYYRQAMLQMRDAYADIRTGVNKFGYTPDYIPFPALLPLTEYTMETAFEKLMTAAWDTAGIAGEKEELAINSGTDFNVNVASFQEELSNIQSAYDNELMEICGTFEGDDGNIYPAIPRFADRSEKTQALMEIAGTPCGMVGNGSINEAAVGISQAELDARMVETQLSNLIREIQIEKTRVEDACDVILTFADFKFEAEGEIHDLEKSIHQTEQAIEDLRRITDLLGTAAGIATGGDTWSMLENKWVAFVWMGSAVVTEIISWSLQGSIIGKEEKIANINEVVSYWDTANDCNLAKIDSDAVVKTKLLEVSELEIDAMKAAYDVSLAISQVSGLQNRAKALLAQKADSERNQINVLAAMNDPNVRIYKNDAIIAADRTFERALKAAYKTTKVWEYSTSQTYAHFGDLYLVRCVNHGDYTLDAYLSELQDSYTVFQEEYGNPDLRVKILSLRDDIFQIPYTVSDNSCGTPLEPSNTCTEENRTRMLRERLAAAELVNDEGYIMIPFTTSIADLSPLTRNHKIEFINVEVQGSDLGDEVARVYLYQDGTGTVRSIENEFTYYSFPPRVGVMDAYINEKVFSDLVYNSYRFKDRPYANSNWYLAINLLDEADNADFDVFNGLRDIRIIIEYTDFTKSL